jgi:hypothetical protein
MNLNACPNVNLRMNLRENFIEVWDEVSLGSIYIAEPKVEPHPNLTGKFEPKSNLIIVEPEPCDLGNK